jgi:hypothetical protein
MLLVSEVQRLIFPWRWNGWLFVAAGIDGFQEKVAEG